MPMTHVNRKRETYYLHAGTTKTGKPRYWFAKSAEGDLAQSIPEGYEVYESPEGQVLLRKIVPQLVLPAEVAVVEVGLKRYAPGQNCIVDVQAPTHRDLPCRASQTGYRGFELRIASVTNDLSKLHEGHAIRASGRQKPDVSCTAVVFPGLGRWLDRYLGTGE